MPSIAQEAFVNMLFNLGRRRFMSFKNMINAAYEQDWEKVSEEMLDSRWANQVGSRARRLSSKIKSLA
jgi:lysozyme